MAWLIVAGAIALCAVVAVFALDGLRRSEQSLRRQTEAALLEARSSQQSEAEARIRESEERKRAELETRKAATNFYFATIAWADRNLRDEDAAGASAHLQECPESLRHWEWHYLQKQCSPALHVLTGHDHPIVSLSFLKDEKLVSTSSDGALLHWDPASGEKSSEGSGGLWIAGIAPRTEPFCLERQGSSGLALEFSPNGTWLAAGRSDKSIALWDLSTNSVVPRVGPTKVLKRHSGNAACGGIYHPANKSKRRGEVHVWDALSGAEVFSANGLSSCVYSLALSPDGKRLVAAVGPLGESGPFDVKLWDVDAGREILTLGRHKNKVHGVAFSKDGKRIASGGNEGLIKIWSIE